MKQEVVSSGKSSISKCRHEAASGVAKPPVAASSRQRRREPFGGTMKHQPVVSTRCVDLFNLKSGVINFGSCVVLHSEK